MSRSSFLVLLMVVLSGLPAGGSIASAQGETIGGEIDIRLSSGRTVVLTPFRIDGKQGFSNAQCGLVIERRRFTVIGAGDLEVYTCRRLVAAGSVPPIDGKERIGLIYDVASPNAAFRTAVLLVRDSEGWAVDKASIGRYDDAAAAQSLAALEKALAQGR